jgi:hypothetical protein
MLILRSVFVIDKSPGTNDVGACDVDGFDEGTMVGDELGVVVGNSDGESLGFVVGDELELGTSLGETDGLIDGTIEGTIEEIPPVLPMTD